MVVTIPRGAMGYTLALCLAHLLTKGCHWAPSEELVESVEVSVFDGQTILIFCFLCSKVDML